MLKEYCAYDQLAHATTTFASENVRAATCPILGCFYTCVNYLIVSTYVFKSLTQGSATLDSRATTGTGQHNRAHLKNVKIKKTDFLFLFYYNYYKNSQHNAAS